MQKLPFEIIFVDQNDDVIRSLWHVFGGWSGISFFSGDLLSVASNTVVSPANSYGYMDGGIDAEYVNFFGQGLQTKVQEGISRREEGFLPVGAAMFVKTGNALIPNMIVAPTMMQPGGVPPSNVFYAMSAILNMAMKKQKEITHLYVPGLGTGVGLVQPEIAAQEMFMAYEKFVGRVFSENYHIPKSLPQNGA
ncbi:Appr-1-p processing domain protein [Magnetococcus marinus MC-1]|uniref:Appr-1-p processing domain protein n=1 Tax=Magnetococcus marinus (strain ATCC BAA-1437 / JCM 17883 / MC-1) TaxID=156889 RepID=A0L954_MAGMM|nr:macro domain-containing protein [Magnetococcus marinus]ABK44497.1 Appr-1-p processing domain protein [Magnetococcus marinus MC-1]